MQKRIVHPKVLSLFKERFSEPTEIQRKAFHVVYSGENTLIIAPTGFGKTEAAVLPVFSRVLETSPRPISILYITPLRALNRDIFDRLLWWADNLGISTALRHGDTSQTERGKQTKKPPQMLITTPETLQSILPAKKLGKHLNNVKWVIVDELHELLDSKRGVQLALALKRLSLRADFQIIALSATIGDVEAARKFLGISSVVRLDKPRGMVVTVELPKPNKSDKEAAARLGMSPVIVARLRRIHELVEQSGAVITFVNTRSMAELLSSRYAMWDKAKNISVHHSSLSRDARVVVEKRFKDGHIKGLVATSSLELGLDIGRVNLVIQYMSPRQVSRLVQRIGRSGHAMDRTPRGVIISNDEEDALEAGVIADFAVEGRFEPVRMYEKPLDILAHQLVGLSLDTGRVRLEDAFSLYRSAYPYRDLTWDEFMSVLRQLEDERLVWLDGDTYRVRRAGYKYYFENLSTIPDESKIWLVNRVNGKTVAVLDEVFVSDNLHIGTVFIAHGTPWRVVDITDKEVIAEPAADFSAGIPDWVGEDIPVPKEVANRVAEAWGGELPRSLDESARKQIMSFAKRLEFVPTPRKIVVESQTDQVVIHIPYGTRINQTLAQLISAYISLSFGRSVVSRADPYRIVVNASTDAVIRALNQISEESLESYLSAHLIRSSMFRNRFFHVARRFGLIGRHVDRQRVSIRRIMDAMVGSPVYNEAMRELFHDKFDIAGARQVISDIHSGEIKIAKWVAHKPSLLSSFLSRGGNYFLPEKPVEEIREIIKKRMLSTYVGLECLNCGHVMYKKVSDLPEKPKCPVCGGTMLTLVDLSDGNKDKIASLINTYGKRAIIVLQGRGIGPNVAARLLKRMRKTDDKLFDDIIEAERTFIRTHRFWKK